MRTNDCNSPILNARCVRLSHLDVSYNRPNLCSNASWDPNGITFANSTLLGIEPYGVFINKRNDIYAVSFNLSLIRVWMNGSNVLSSTFVGNLLLSESIFVTPDDDVFVDNGASRRRIDKWTPNSSNLTWAMNVTKTCTGLFVDTNNSLYCAMWEAHRVIKRPLTNNTLTPTTIAGDGTAGSRSNMLNGPVGIFVDTNFNLYVADSQNHRVQLFTAGQINGTSLMGRGASVNSTLKFPRGVVLDFNGNLYVTDSENHRIVTIRDNRFLCIVGCTGGGGSAANQLREPATTMFDTFGNLFVIDKNNARMQKFPLVSNSCGEYICSRFER